MHVTFLEGEETDMWRLYWTYPADESVEGSSPTEGEVFLAEQQMDSLVASYHQIQEGRPS